MSWSPESRLRERARQLDDQADVERQPAPGVQAILLAAYTIGIILLGVQLWLLTVALELYLGGEGEEAWLLAVFSAIVFAGGLIAIRLLGREPRPGIR